MRSKNSPTVAISSAGGHLTEMLIMIEQGLLPIDHVITDVEYVKQLENSEYIPLINFHRSIILALWSIFTSFILAARLRPRVVMTTGAGMVIPFCVICKLVFRSRLINIETGARIRSSSQTFRLLYFISDISIVRTVEQQKNFSNALVRSL